eukprot:570720-Karenia_brevis.AAC.1
MKNLMREAVREEIGGTLAEVKNDMAKMKDDIESATAQAERASSTASAAMEAVRALEVELKKNRDGERD